MADPAVAIPPLGRMFLTAIWVESMLYGVNVIIFATTVFILTVKDERVNKFLLAGAIVLFCITTAHMGISFCQLLQAYVSPQTETPHGSDLYWAIWNHLQLTQLILYDCAVWAQDLLLIWRLYVVWGQDWKIVILPLAVETLHMGCAFTATGLLGNPSTNIFSNSVKEWGYTSWSLDIIMNTSVTAAIAIRLWLADRRTRRINLSSRVYVPALLVMVESGAIYAGTTLVLFGLEVSGSPAGSAGIYALTQLASIVPLLIVVRVRMGLNHRAPENVSAIDTSGGIQFGRFGTQTTVRVSRSEGARGFSMETPSSPYGKSDAYKDDTLNFRTDDRSARSEHADGQ